ncbi:Pre-mRNA-splicing factor ATP-dependent RNA helicase PRP16 [Coemansia spiralis]|uniref:Pre-mRNA-splicing factor ATP-dependent RNA helicase PRP16 n=2 Tax=Coemansia TaxID=4863 RepID=A0A9W8G528_9FUNG|nr:Pre-mRNA-splicing factor ATP-dependent RNA helicase PRP16 [Coemansia umbellata]KAJ2619814.1 Pre-mRNA-splicing factor ATP-dependent RNA helicase PRP16 [Coemansia sp. RSA 1358]KAJ2672156.1 Pre-mRNA-splicing factor ATP-dependent RNA helicase PRP16 [Coemansia spiralis]
MDLEKQEINAKLVDDISKILKRASGATAQLATDVVCRRLAQFGSKATSLQQFENACKMFGRFDSNALEATYSAILAHQKHKNASNLTKSVFGNMTTAEAASATQSATLISSDDQQPGGGLVYVPKSKRHQQQQQKIDNDPAASTGSGLQYGVEKGKSALGLDKLAAKLREEAVKSMNKNQMSFAEQDEQEEDISNQKATFRQPHIPANLRQRRADTPSDPGGVSSSAQQRLEDHRRRLSRLEGSRKGGLSYESGGRGHGRHQPRSRSRSRSRSKSPRRNNRDGRSSHQSRSRNGSSRRYSEHSTDSHPHDRRVAGSTRGRWDAMTPVSLHGEESDRFETGSRSIRSGNRPVSSRRSGWDEPTPRHRQIDTPRWRQSTIMQGSTNGADRRDGEVVEDRGDWDTTQRQLDRDWYNIDESGGAVDNAHNPFADYVEHDNKLEAKLIGQQAKRMNARQMQYSKDNELWINSRLMQSGIVQAASADEDDDDADKNRIHLLVHDLKPPFLDGTVLTKQLDPVKTVVDPTSDLAVFARKGSALVRELREKRERMKATRDAVNMAGTMLGNVMGVTTEDSDHHKFDDNKEEHNQHDQYQPTHSQQDEQVTAAENCVSGSSEFSRTRSIREQREYLPAFACRSDLLRVISDNQVTVVVGETGSGKTTQLAQYLHEAGYTKFGMVGCTQPRRVAAMSVAKRVAEEMDVKLGEEVGYAIRFEDCTSKQTKLKYMTDGVLLRETLTKRDLGQYSAIIMDEAHERTLNTDVLLGLLKQIVATRRDLKLIVTSATMNAQRFADFFGNAPVFTIPGRTFPVDIMFSKSACEDYVDSAVRQVLTIHLSQSDGDILVFMAGQEDIEACCETVRERLAVIDGAKPLNVLPIYSQLPADLQAKIFEPSPVRKVVVATNIAETSLTVDGVKYVVDSGYYKLKVYNPRIGMDSLQVTPISQASANQRSGRAGRTGPGIAYRLYTERAFKHEMYPSPIPEIQRTNLSYVVILLKSIGVDNLLDFDFLDPPPQDTIKTSMYQLWTLGSLDNTGHITQLGRKMVELPLDPAPAKMLVTAHILGCTAEVVTIVSMLAVPSVFYRPKERLDESDAAREKFFVPESDHLTLLNAYNQWRSNGYRDSWCTRHFIHSKSMRKAREVREQLVDILQGTLKLELKSAGANWDIIRQCICSAYFHQAARTKSLGEYTNLRTGMPCHVHPTSALYGMGYTPDYIVYHELVYTSKEYMQCVTAVDPKWLAEMGPMFFSLREAGASRKKHADIHMAKMESEFQQAQQQEEAAKAELERRRVLSRTSRSNIVTPGGAGNTPRFKTPRRRTNI